MPYLVPNSLQHAVHQGGRVGQDLGRRTFSDPEPGQSLEISGSRLRRGEVGRSAD